MPAGAYSAIVYSLNTTDRVKDNQRNNLYFADVVCNRLYQYIVFNHYQWFAFDDAYRNQSIYRGPVGVNGNQLVLDFGVYQGQPLAAEVNRTCPGDVTPGFKASAAYTGISSDMQGRLTRP
ncbi:MAG: hypothetical protein EXR62_16295, partial [Chloroflexi bacterium]|nr:hypothetical protein [Chloroflexota bacterium]